MTSRLVGAAILALCSAGCASGSAPESPGSHEIIRLHTYVSSQTGIFANAYILEIGRGLIVVDATLTVTDAKGLRAQVDALSKPLLAVFITHGHPDHYNGLTELVTGRGPVPIYATPGVDRVIREWDERKEQQWKGMFGQEWPAKRTFPNHTIADGETVTLDGVRFTPHDLGPGESHHDSYWLVRSRQETYAFVGDLVFNGEHSYVSDGHTGDWLANLERVRRSLSGIQLYPGHGLSGGLELLDVQKAYLEQFRREVARLSNGKALLTEDEKKELTQRMTTYLPAGKLTFLIGVGADSVAAELANPPTRKER